MDLSYSLEVSLCWLLFFSFYWLFLRKDTFFGMQRGYLILTLLLGFFIPSLSLFPSSGWNSEVATIFLEEISVGASSAIQAETVLTNHWKDWVWGIYCLVTSILVLRFLYGLLRIGYLAWSGEITPKERYLIIQTQAVHSPFSFFFLLFINEDKTMEEFDRQQIIRHEEAHIQGWHSLDVLALELLTILFWFNPLLFLYKNALRIVHEYLADAAVLETTPTARYGRLLIAQSIPGIRLANNFNHSQLQKRINMMTKSKSSSLSLLKYTAILPLLLLTLFLFSCQENTATVEPEIESTTERTEKVEALKDENGVYSVVQEMPRFPGCEDLNGSLKEKNKCAEGEMLKFIYTAVKYPTVAKEKGVEGMVVISFIIDKDGAITQAEIKRNPGEGLGEEALQVVETMPNWIPGKQDGLPVNVKYNLPVKFKLQD